MGKIIDFTKVLKAKRDSDRLNSEIEKISDILTKYMNEFFYLDSDIEEAIDYVEEYILSNNITDIKNHKLYAAAFNTLVNQIIYYIDESDKIAELYNVNKDDLKILLKKIYDFFEINEKDYNIYAPYNSKDDFLENIVELEKSEFAEDLEEMVFGFIEIANKKFGEANYKLALDLYKQALKFDVKDVNTYINISSCYIELNKFYSAILYLKEALKYAKEKEIIKSIKTMIKLTEKMLKEYRYDYQSEYDDFDNLENADELIELAEKAMNNNSYRLALGLYNQALRYDQNNELIYIGISVCCIELNMLKDAIKNLHEAFEIAENKEPIKDMLIECYKALEEQDE